MAERMFECALKDDPGESPSVIRNVDSYEIESFHTSLLSSFKESYDRLGSFSMLTFNAGLFEFRLFGLGLYHNPPFTNKRLRHIPGKLRRANADIVALQEVYLKEHASFIIKELIDLYPYATRDSYIPNEETRSIFVEDKGVVRKSNKMGIPLMHSGLLFLSKYPIIGAKFHPWTELTYLEAMFSNKGFLEVLVLIPTIGKVAFYNMHMASASINPESKHVEQLRLEEVKQLLATTESTALKGFVPIIIGDLNAAPNTCASNYTHFIDKGWGDSYLMAKGLATQGLPVVSEDAKPRTRKKRIQIDPVFGSPKPSDDSIGASDPDVDVETKAPRWNRFFKNSSLWRNIRSVYSGRSNAGGRKGKISIKKVAFEPTRRGMFLHKRPSKSACDDVTKTYRLLHSRTFKVRRGSHFDEDGVMVTDDGMVHDDAIMVPDDAMAPEDGSAELPHEQVGVPSSRASVPPGMANDPSSGPNDPSSRHDDPFSKRNMCGNVSMFCGDTERPEKKSWRNRIYKPFFVISHKGKARWWHRRSAKSYTWDPENPLNKIGPHSSCNGLRCDYIFLPPPEIAGHLADYYPKSGEILFKDPTVAIHRNSSGCGCIFSMLSSFERVMLVTLSDHYALKIVMNLR